MKNKKSSIDSNIDKYIFGYFDSKMSKIEAKYPFEKNYKVVHENRFEKRKDRVINVVAVAGIALMFVLGALNFEPPRALENGIKNYYEYHDLENRIPVVMKQANDFLYKYK